VPEKTIRCRLITPEERVLDAEVTYASVPLHDGSAGFQHHTGAIVAKLGFGELRLEFPQGESRSWFIDGGFVQNVDDTLTILAGGATASEDLDPEEARAELAESRARTSHDTEEMDRITELRQRAQAKAAIATRR
jgi:F0F1-type ATP synthase epsilon subunit